MVLRTWFFLRRNFLFKLRLIQLLLALNISCFSHHWTSSWNVGGQPCGFPTRRHKWMDCTELPGHSITPECSAIEHSIEHSPTMRSVADLMAEGQSLSLSAHAACARGWYYSHPCCGLNCVPPKWQHLEIWPLWRLVRLNGVIRLGPNPIGLMSLSEEKEKPELSAFRRTRRKGHVRTQLGREPSTGSNPDCTLGLDFQPPEPRKSKCVV